MDSWGIIKTSEDIKSECICGEPAPACGLIYIALFSCILGQCREHFICFISNMAGHLKYFFPNMETDFISTIIRIKTYINLFKNYQSLSVSVYFRLESLILAYLHWARTMLKSSRMCLQSPPFNKLQFFSSVILILKCRSLTYKWMSATFKPSKFTQCWSSPYKSLSILQ